MPWQGSFAQVIGSTQQPWDVRVLSISVLSHDSNSSGFFYLGYLNFAG
jgi:hypothetical protein